MNTPILELIDLHKSYGGRIALQHVHLRVEEGEMFGLLGPNGAGKTTLLSIVANQLEKTSGEIRLMGRTLRPNDQELRSVIGVVPQELALYGELTVRENLTFFGALYGFGKRLLNKNVERVLQALDLITYAELRLDVLSGGVKRRVNLGAALVHQPRLLLLDEPTTGIDPQSRKRIFDEVRRLNADGVTVVFTGHYMEEVQALCQRIAIIDGGRLIACDLLPELLRQLDGWIRFTLRDANPAIHSKLAMLPDVRLTKTFDDVMELHCRDMRATLLRLVAMMREEGLEMTSLVTQEPNLERVFLHLTGRALRD